MNKQMKEFIQSHIDMIDNNEFTEIYTELVNGSFTSNFVAHFTKIMFDADINPMPYLEVLPPTFCQLTDITKIDIPDNIQRICSSAFLLCKQLEKLDLGRGVNSIDSNAFYGCENLKELVIPSNVKILASYSFGRCGLESVTIEAGVSSIGKGTFHECKNLNSITFTGTIEQWKQIKLSADWKCSELKTVKCSDGELEL